MAHLTTRQRLRRSEHSTLTSQQDVRQFTELVRVIPTRTQSEPTTRRLFSVRRLNFPEQTNGLHVSRECLRYVQGASGCGSKEKVAPAIRCDSKRYSITEEIIDLSRWTTALHRRATTNHQANALAVAIARTVHTPGDHWRRSPRA